MKKSLKKIFIALLTTATSIVIVCLVLVYLALQPVPTVTDKQQISADAAQQSQQLAKRIAATLKQNTNVSVIATSQHEINGLTALFNRAFPKASIEVQLSNVGAAANGTLALPLPTFIRYLNIHAIILPSSKGLDIEQITVGDLAINGSLFLKLVTWLADSLIQAGMADKALAMITAVEINEQQLVTHLKLNENFNTKQNKSVLMALRDELALFGDVEKIAFYYQSLSEFAAQQPVKSSIATYVSYLFDLAKVRRGISDEYSALAENQQALMALVIYFGADRFETLVGDVIIRDRESLIIRNRLRNNVTLQDRVDLQKHFIYSMALQLFSTHGASDALGEFKEFLDTNEGGSGFSFADLQADRAGTRLAMIVTKSEHHALQAQDLLASVIDQQLLPSINGLQEGLHQQSFAEEFKHVDSKQYQQTLSDIDSRLKSLPVYQLGWE